MAIIAGVGLDGQPIPLAATRDGALQITQQAAGADLQILILHELRAMRLGLELLNDLEAGELLTASQQD